MGAVDPLLTPKLTDRRELIRELTGEQTYRFFRQIAATLLAYTAGNPASEVIFTDQGRTDANFVSGRIRISNDGGNWLQYSFDYDSPTVPAIHGALAPGEVITDDEHLERLVYIRSVGGPTSCRIWVW